MLEERRMLVFCSLVFSEDSFLQDLTSRASMPAAGSRDLEPKRSRAGQSERFISRAAFARRYGIDNRTAARFLEDQGVPFRDNLREGGLLIGCCSGLLTT
jgi:hypothetical protein